MNVPGDRQEDLGPGDDRRQGGDRPVGPEFGAASRHPDQHPGQHAGQHAGQHPDQARLPGSDPFARRPRRRRVPWAVLGVTALGGGLGSLSRYGLAQAWPADRGAFPLATFVTNVTGCLALGALMVYLLDVWPPNRYLRPFLGVGFLGGYTTFSSYTIELLDMLVRGRWLLADSYALDSLFAGLFATWAGITLARLAAGKPLRGAGRNRGSHRAPAAPARATRRGAQR